MINMFTVLDVDMKASGVHGAGRGVYQVHIWGVLVVVQMEDLHR